uniref:RNA2 polyprotein n=2 Tax=Cowpea mosaic virus TaxID=12264 RepID=A0A8F2JGJ0_CPMV|nr:polyprotein 2 [Cowpea mosaic virus]
MFSFTEAKSKISLWTRSAAPLNNVYLSYSCRCGLGKRKLAGGCCSAPYITCYDSADFRRVQYLYFCLTRYCCLYFFLLLLADWFYKKTSIFFETEFSRGFQTWRKIVKFLYILPKFEMESIMSRGIPSGILEEKAIQFKRAKEGNKPLKDEIPKPEDMYVSHTSKWNVLRKMSQKTVDLSKAAAGMGFVNKHMLTGNILAQPTTVLDIPVTKDKTLAMASDFIRKENLKTSAIHIGAIEIIIQSFASPESDLMGGFLLVDSLHTDTANAIRSIFVAPMRGGRPVRVVTFPNTLAPVSCDLNNRFKLICSLPNCDIVQGSQVAEVSVNVAGCATSIEKSHTPSQLYTEEFEKEGAVVVEYLGRQTYCAQPSNLPTEEKLRSLKFDFHVEQPSVLKLSNSCNAHFVKGESLKYSISGKEAENHAVHATVVSREGASVAPKQYDPILGRVLDPRNGNVAIPQTEQNLFALSLDDTSSVRGSLLDTKFAQTRVLLSKAMAGGDVLLDEYLYDVVNGQDFRATVAFLRTHVITGKIKVTATTNISDNSGCCLMLAINSGVRGKYSTDVYTICSQDSMTWNPGCKKNFSFTFNPNPCGDSWSAEMISRSRVRMTVICVSGWTLSPTTDVIAKLDWSIVNEKCEPTIYHLADCQNWLPLNRWMGKLIFPQGVTSEVRRMPLSIGGGAGATQAFLANMPNSWISMWRYFRGELHFEVTKMSSPYIKATVTFLIAFGNLSDAFGFYESFPHRIVQFAEVEEKCTLVFSQQEFVTAWSTQVNPRTTLEADGCPYLYAIIHDSTTGTISGDFNLGVKLVGIKDFCGIGSNPGIDGSRLLGAIAQGPVCAEASDVYSPCMIASTPPAPFSDVTAVTFDLINGKITPVGDDNWNTHIYNPPIMNVLRTAAWKSGTVHVQLNVRGAGVKRADWDGQVFVYLRQSMNPESYDARTFVISQPGSAMLNFSFDIIGPNSGFEFAESPWANQTTWYLECVATNPRQIQQFEVNMRFDPNFRVAGNILMPPFPLSTETPPLLKFRFRDIERSKRSVMVGYTATAA